MTVSRPGYAASTAAPPGLAVTAWRVASLADEPGLERFGVWGLSGGGPFALARGALTPHRVTRVVGTAGPAEGDEPEDEASLSAEAADMGSAFTALDTTAEGGA